MYQTVLQAREDSTFRKNEAGISSMFLYHATILIHGKVLSQLVRQMSLDRFEPPTDPIKTSSIQTGKITTSPIHPRILTLRRCTVHLKPNKTVSVLAEMDC